MTPPSPRALAVAEAIAAWMLLDLWIDHTRLPEKDQVAKLAARIAQALDAETERWKKAVADLREYARHSEGCSAPFGFACKCGYDALAATLRSDAPTKEE